MDPARSAAITSSLRAYQAWSLVVEHHPRGLESFALDAYIECGRVDALLAGSEYACRILRPLAFPGDGFEVAGSLALRRYYQSLRQAQLVTRIEVQAAVIRLFDLTYQMEDDEFLALGVEANRYLQEQ